MYVKYCEMAEQEATNDDEDLELQLNANCDMVYPKTMILFLLNPNTYLVTTDFQIIAFFSELQTTDKEKTKSRNHVQH